ncbi:transposase [Streptomyces sp. Act-28]
MEPLLPKGRKADQPPTRGRRQLIDGIRWRTRTRTPGRDVPERYGPWGRVCDLFRRRQRDGSRQRIFTEPQVRADARGLIAWDLDVDSTVRRAHRHATRARKRRTCERNRRVASPPGRTTMASNARAAARPPGSTWPPSKDGSPCRSWSWQGSAGTPRRSSPSWRRSVCPASGRAGPAPGPIARADKAYAPRGNRACPRRRGIRRTIPDGPTMPATAGSSAPAVAAHRSSTRSTTGSGTRWSAGTTG